MDRSDFGDTIENDLDRGLLVVRMQARVGDYAGMAETCRAIVKNYPDCLLLLRLMAFCEMELARPAEAAEYFRRCRKIDPEDETVYVGLALCAEAQGDEESAVKELRRAQEIAFDDEWIAQELARLGAGDFTSDLMEARRALVHGDPDRAARLLEAGPATGDVVADLTLLHAFWEQGRLDDAWAICGKVAREYPNCVTILLYLRMRDAAMERSLNVRMLMRRVEEIDPGLRLYGSRMEAAGTFV